MAVRNINAIGATKQIPVWVWIPPQYNLIHKIELYDGTTATDVTDIVIEGDYNDGVTELIGNFSFKIDNSTQAYTDLFSPYDKIRIYLDYGTEATTMRFVGLIERISKSEHTLVITGRGTAAKFIGKNVTYWAINMPRSTILSQIISQYFTELTTTNLESDAVTATVNYVDMPFFDVVEEICSAAGFDAYIDKDNDFHYFESGSRQNTTEAVVHGYNLIETGDFSPDASNIYNKVKVYGAEIGGMPIIATAQDTTSQTTYGIKELKINDSSIITTTQAQARADYELSINKDPPIIGEVTSLGLPTIAPGEMIRISDPMNGLDPNYYAIQGFTHKFSNDEPVMTTLTVQKQRSTIPKILKKRIKFESRITATTNPFELDYSEIFDFSTDTGTHDDTEIEINPATNQGVLKTTGGATGTWISETISLDDNIAGFEIRFSGSNLEGTEFSISTNGGITYNPVWYGRSVPTGQDIKIKVSLKSASARLDTLAFLYKY